MSHTDIEGSQVLEGRISGEHTASQLLVQDCTTVYGDCRGIADDEAVQDACAVHGLNCRGRLGAIERTLGRNTVRSQWGVLDNE